MSEWNSPFIKGFSTCFTICSVIAAVAIYFNNTIISLKDEEISKLEKEISNQVDFSEKFHQEQAIRRQTELREAELKEQLGILTTKKWEEKYLSEHLAKQSLEERIVLLEVKNKELLDAINNNKPDPKKDIEIESLKKELTLAKNELAKLRKLYTQDKAKSYAEIPVDKTASNSNSQIFEMIKTTIPRLGSSDSRDLIVSTYKGTNYKITITQLSQVVYRMGSLNILETISAISDNIVNDNNQESLTKF